MTDQPPDNQSQSDPELSPPIPKQDLKQADAKRTRDELDEAIRGNEDVIHQITTPLQLRPITLTLTRAKLTANKGTLTGTHTEMSLPITDVQHVSYDNTGTEAFVMVDKKVLSKEPPFSLGPFSPADAEEMAAICQGYVLALERKIDLNPLPVDEVRDKLRELGNNEIPNDEGSSNQK